MPGRKRTPTALRLLRGNPSGRPINRDEPQPDALETACPVELTDDAARAEWIRAIVPAIRIGQITSSDKPLAVAHCELWATWQSQLAEAVKHPHVIAAGKHKYPMPNPARVMANKTLHLLGQVDEKLGFTPTSRSKVQVKGPGSVQTTLDKRRAKFFALSRG
jgi:P27 family predicted phage terminase small subunit